MNMKQQPSMKHEDTCGKLLYSAMLLQHNDTRHITSITLQLKTPAIQSLHINKQHNQLLFVLRMEAVLKLTFKMKKASYKQHMAYIGTCCNHAGCVLTQQTLFMKHKQN